MIEVFAIAVGEGEGGDDDIEFGDSLGEGFAGPTVATVLYEEAYFGSKAFDFAYPVSDDGGRDDEEGGADLRGHAPGDFAFSL